MGRGGGRAGRGAAYGAWFIKDAALKWWGIRLERFGQPFLVVHVPEGTDKDPVTGIETSNITLAKEQYSNITAKTVFIHSKGFDESSKWDVQLLGPEGGVRNEYQDAIRYLDTEIMRAMLMPSLLIVEPEHSSRAQAQINLDMFELANDALMRDLVHSVMVEQLARPLVTFNFGPDAPMGTWTILPLSPEDKGTLSTMFKNAVGFQALNPAIQEDLDFIRQELGFPPATKEAAAANAQSRLSPDTGNADSQVGAVRDDVSRPNTS